MPRDCCLSHYSKKVTVQKLDPNASADAHGVVDQTNDANWITHCKLWCAVQSKGGREFWKVDQVNADVSHAWRTQYSSEANAITPEMRLSYDGGIYEVASVVNVDLADHEIEIQTVRAV